MPRLGLASVWGFDASVSWVSASISVSGLNASCTFPDLLAAASRNEMTVTDTVTPLRRDVQAMTNMRIHLSNCHKFLENFQLTTVSKPIILHVICH